MAEKQIKKSIPKSKKSVLEKKNIYEGGFAVPPALIAAAAPLATQVVSDLSKEIVPAGKYLAKQGVKGVAKIGKAIYKLFGGAKIIDDSSIQLADGRMFIIPKLKIKKAGGSIVRPGESVHTGGKKGKFVKGSQEAKDYMAKIRAMKKKA